jgi:uncharacterized OsmC-like protein
VDEGGVLVIRRISVHYRLAAPLDRREEIERVRGFHARFCPVARSIGGSIEIETHLDLTSSPLSDG